MAFICEYCGYRNSEIKEGAGIGDKARRITFSVDCADDLNRDVFKSDTSRFSLKELDFTMDAGTLGSLYTTVEGLLAKLYDELEANNPFGQGDSADSKKYLDFLDRISKLRNGDTPFTLEIDDPAANCFIYNPYAPEADPKLKVEDYPRTAE